MTERLPETIRRLLAFKAAGRAGDRRSRRRVALEPGSEPFAPGRDPAPLGDTMDALALSLGWQAALAQSRVITSWAAIVGEATAAHAAVVAIEDGVLSVLCDSTAWATQLRLMRRDLLTRLADEYPEAGIDDIRFAGPDVPSWKRGPRSVPGRGPRDTYG